MGKQDHRLPQGRPIGWLAIGALVGGTVVGVWDRTGLQPAVAPAINRAAHQVLRDRLRVVLQVDPPAIRQGEEIRITVLVSDAAITTPGGIVEVICDDGGKLEPLGGTQLAVPPTAHPIMLTPVSCRGVHAGDARVTARVTIPMSVEVVDATVRIKDAASSGQPSGGNLSGTWPMFVGAIDGSMSLQHRGSRVSGDYTLGNGKIGSILGIADGGKFIVRLLDSKAVEGFKVDGSLSGANGMIEIAGTAEKLIAIRDRWEPVPGSPLRFHATSGGPGLPSATRSRTDDRRVVRE